MNVIKESRGFNDSRLPNTMIYERIILERPDLYTDILYDELEVKNKISELMAKTVPSKIYTDLFRMNLHNYLTTNYDYGFIDSIKDLPEVNLPIHEYSTESVYSMRRLKRISIDKELKKNFWQIHGEIDRSPTIMLGLDHYCGLIGKIDSYIKGGYKYVHESKQIVEVPIEQKFRENSFNGSSWVELFFMSNVHIIGFSLDYCETDLWWIINKRARMLRSIKLRELVKNEIHFHCEKIDEQKKELLEGMNIFVHVIELNDKIKDDNEKYIDYYKKLIKRLGRLF